MSITPPDTLYLEPFQLRLPDSQPMFRTNAEGYSTFVAKLQRGLLGVEAELTLFTVETEGDDYPDNFDDEGRTLTEAQRKEQCKPVAGNVWYTNCFDFCNM